MDSSSYLIERPYFRIYKERGLYNTTTFSVIRSVIEKSLIVVNEALEESALSFINAGVEVISGIIESSSSTISNLFTTSSTVIKNEIFLKTDERLTYLEDAISNDADMDKNVFIHTSQIFKQLLARSNIDQWPYIGLVEPGYINAEWRSFKDYERLSIFIIGRDNIMVSCFDKSSHLIVEHLTFDTLDQSRLVLPLAV